MKRELAKLVFAEHEVRGFAVGDQAAHIAAADLANRADAPTIMALADILRMADLVGGQMTITAFRVGPSQRGEWETKGLDITMETRDARLVVVQPPDEVFGTPVTEFLEDAPEVSVEEAAGLLGDPEEDDEPEPEPDAEPLAVDAPGALAD
jgi:hypothetical protein